MALTKGTNSYATVDEADTYFENRLDVAAWIEATTSQKEQALITATATIDEQKWGGYAVSASQALAHPRALDYFDPKMGRTLSTSSTSVADRVINGTLELAYHLLNNDGLLDSTGQVTDITVGKISLTSIRTSSIFPKAVLLFIQPLLVNGGDSAWWRSN
jgi:hypothetical protein